MVRLFDNLNTPKLTVLVLVLFLVVDGFLFYRYWLTEATAASVPSHDAAPAAAKEDATSPSEEDAEPSEEDAAPSEQEEPAIKESDDEAELPNAEKQGVVGAEETKTEPETVQTPYPVDPAQPANQPTPVAVENTAELPAPVPAPVYLDPVYEENTYDE